VKVDMQSFSFNYTCYSWTLDRRTLMKKLIGYTAKRVPANKPTLVIAANKSKLI